MYLTQSDINTVGRAYYLPSHLIHRLSNCWNIKHYALFCWQSIDCLLVLLSTHPKEFSRPVAKHSNVFDRDLDPNTHFFHGNKNTDIQGGAKSGPQTHDHNSVKIGKFVVKWILKLPPRLHMLLHYLAKHQYLTKPGDRPPTVTGSRSKSR